ncbi:hypothetical protein QUA43_03790 [Microcoleus sp. N9_B4]
MAIRSNSEGCSTRYLGIKAKALSRATVASNICHPQGIAYEKTSTILPATVQ